MSPDDVKALATYYDTSLRLSNGVDIEAKREHNPTVPHLLYMCEEIPKFIDEGKIEKSMRWLGFLQGVFCEHGYYTIDQLKEHNRSDKDGS